MNKTQLDHKFMHHLKWIFVLFSASKCSLTEFKKNCSCPSDMERKDDGSDCGE